MSKVQPNEPLTDAEEERVHDADELWQRAFAAKIVVQDFEQAQRFRTTNHDWRWRSADELYTASVSQKTWEGTRQPRSSLGIFLTFQQIESFLPRAISAIFGQDPWFETLPMHGTSVGAAKAAQNLLLEQLSSCTIREQVRRTCKSALVYGNGIMALEWLHQEREVTRWLPVWTPKKQSVRGLDGRTVSVPTGEFVRSKSEQKFMELENRPIVSHVSIKDFYIDPNCPSPIPQDARFVIRRVMTPIDQIVPMQGKDGWLVPPTKMMIQIADGQLPADADQSKLFTEVARGGQWDPAHDYTADPGGRRVEVLHYWTRERHVRVLRSGQFTWTLLNTSNPFGFIPFYNIPYADMLDRFYGLALTDVLEGEQRFQQALLNARVDELALSLHPPTVRARGMDRVPLHQLRQRPGAIATAEDPSKHLIRLFPQNVTQQAFAEHAASEQRAQRVTGMSDAAMVSGTAQTQTRSATAANSQQQASLARVQYFVENFESTVLECLLKDTLELNKRYLDPNQIVRVGEGQKVDPMEIFGAEVKMKVQAGSRMASQVGLLQTFPLIFQTLMQPQLQAQLQQQGLTVNYQEALDILLTATGYRERAELVRPLTEEEQEFIQQQAQQVPPAERIKKEMQDSRMQDITELQGQKFEQDSALEIVKQIAKSITEPPEIEGVV